MRLCRPPVVCHALFLFLMGGLSPARSAPAELERGAIDGAQFTIARSSARAWNHRILLIAHGYRPESAPLVADLFPDQLAYRTLLDEGWLVAKTSYRRNGIIMADAVADLDNLRAHIVDAYGQPERVIVEGDSMGGTIATLLAERGGSLYDGLIAIGAALDLREAKGSPGVTLRPQLPLLLLANRSEISGPTAYMDKASSSLDRLTQPVLFRIDRDGHVNVNQAERLAALRALNTWLDHGRAALPKTAPGAVYDVTQPPSPQPSLVTLDEDHRGLTATVTEVSAIYGNVWLDIQPADLAAIGLSSGLWAELVVGAQSYRVRHGTDFDSVERGQWVLFPNADGFCWLARNWGNAAATAQLEVGTKVHLRRFEDSPAKP